MSAGVGFARARAAAGVMQSRAEPPDSLDFFPTPPWAVRAFAEEVLFPHLAANRTDEVAEPACGEGHMAAPLQEFFPRLRASDVHPYGYGEVIDFLDPATQISADWFITNPPFNAALSFAIRALAMARKGVCLLVRTQWLHTEERYALFRDLPPTLVAYSVERIPMHRGRWEPNGVTTTDYLWVCWRRAGRDMWKPLPSVWIPPGQKRLRMTQADIARFARPADAPLLEGGA